MAKLKKQLDIRSFLKMYLEVRLLFKRVFTKDQRRIFAFQRDRLPMLEDEDSFDSDLNVEQDIHHLKTVNEFTSLIGKYKIETDLDRRLLLGVLVRDCSSLKQGGNWHQDYSSESLTTERETYLVN